MTRRKSRKSGKAEAKGSKKVIKGAKGVGSVPEKSRRRDVVRVEKIDESLEDVYVPINPYHLFQFIHGYFTSAMKVTDSALVGNTIPRISIAFLIYIKDPLSGYNQRWPKPLLELAAQLRARRVGRTAYAPNWEAVDDFYHYSRTSVGWLADPANSGVMIQYFDLNTVSASGFNPNIASTMTFDAADNRTIREFLIMYESYFEFHDVLRMDELDDKSGSAFAFASQNPSLFMSSNNVNATSLIHLSGFSGTAPLWSMAIGSVASETKITKPWVSHLKLGTNFVGMNTPTVFPQGAFQRANVSSLSCVATPGLIGYKMANKIKGSAILKQVPSIGILNGIVSKLETIGAQIGAPFTSALGGNDVKLYAYCIFRRMLSQYAGSSVGLYIGEFAPRVSHPLEMHYNDEVVCGVRLPEPISDFIGAASSYYDGEGLIIPCITLVSPAAVTVTLSYTGTPVSDLATNTLCPTIVFRVMQKFKELEILFASYCNMRKMGNYGKSLLDTTLFVSDLKVVGLAARRSLTQDRVSYVLTRGGAISYSVSPIGTSNDMTSWASDRLHYNHTYRQTHRKDLGTSSDIPGWSIFSKYDGYVLPGTLSTNIEGNDSPSAVPLQAPEHLMSTQERVVHAIKDSGSKALGLQWGNYCGYNWSGGMRGGKPPMRDGKYLATPLSREDEACKEHDEGYFHAGRDPELVRAADKKFVERLDGLAKENLLSIGGKLAREYFRPSAPRDKSEL